MDITSVIIIAIALPACIFILWDAKKDKERMRQMGKL